MEPIYLDNASTSFPKPPQVAQAMFDYVTGCGCNIGRGGYEGAYQAEETVLRTRQQLCRLFHGRTSHHCAASHSNLKMFRCVRTQIQLRIFTEFQFQIHQISPSFRTSMTGMRMISDAIAVPSDVFIRTCTSTLSQPQR